MMNFGSCTHRPPPPDFQRDQAWGACHTFSFSAAVAGVKGGRSLVGCLGSGGSFRPLLKLSMLFPVHQPRQRKGWGVTRALPEGVMGMQLFPALCAFTLMAQNKCSDPKHSQPLLLARGGGGEWASSLYTGQGPHSGGGEHSWHKPWGYPCQPRHSGFTGLTSWKATASVGIGAGGERPLSPTSHPHPWEASTYGGKDRPFASWLFGYLVNIHQHQGTLGPDKTVGFRHHSSAGFSKAPLGLTWMQNKNKNKKPQQTWSWEAELGGVLSPQPDHRKKAGKIS